MMQDLPLSDAYQFIEPGPVALLTTQMPGRKPNVMAMSWHMVLGFEPALIGCVVARANHSYAALLTQGEAVIAVPPAGLARIVTGVGNCTGDDTDKFGNFDLTPLPAARIAAPLIGEAIVNLECRLRDRTMVKAYDMFVLECVKGWVNPALREAPMLHHHGYGAFSVDGERVTLKSRMK